MGMWKNVVGSNLLFRNYGGGWRREIIAYAVSKMCVYLQCCSNEYAIYYYTRICHGIKCILHRNDNADVNRPKMHLTGRTASPNTSGILVLLILDLMKFA